ncbi:hypothetical protein [Sodalis sp. (in: enterobacteria)]|uniref:hypothetical protein n=1 Tax=Sodalis sp. (in: enterobacteria) TaxID=1898979 RepID=UPI003F68721B
MTLGIITSRHHYSNIKVDKEFVMSLSLKVYIGQHSLAIDPSRIGRLLSPDKDYATHLGIWDRIKNFFRPHNKSDALDCLYRLIHSDNLPGTPGGEGKSTSLHTALNAFTNLKALTKEEDKALFCSGTLNLAT